MKPQTIISIRVSEVRTELHIDDKNEHDLSLGVSRALDITEGIDPTQLKFAN